MEKKYLDAEGLQYLWSKLSLEDYPNNELLIAVINAIDEGKADKTEIPTKVSELATNVANKATELAGAIDANRKFTEAKVTELVSDIAANREYTEGITLPCGQF